ncbi:FHA domain-containing protein [Runella aurantiaca]|uniref:FHA domain-containing protein n=1 Tax=Runella aurantiaca TaxID=2282308 RepID=A0A369HYG2_9BACT|nr:FHA domain-containing protein [Runella aurantiaca]RDB02388.1 FHA domain-containing protein [Runella aurantiaca]
MTTFKNTIVPCQKCGKLIAVKVRDFENGAIQCTHTGCGHINQLTLPYYDERILQGLPSFGHLIYHDNPSIVYPLRFGINVVGHSSSCHVHVERFLHEGKCYLSRRHCTIEVLFDKWDGNLRYQIQDGAIDSETGDYKNSLNGTLLNGYLLQNGEKIDVTDQGLVCLGGIDVFRLEVYQIPQAMRQTYLTFKPFELDETQ